MTERQPPTGSGFADEIVEVSSYSASLPVKKDFLPWHLPRKQYVRKEQWLNEIRRLLVEVPRSESTLNYLGLPGVDLLDLRYLYENVCEPDQLTLRFLGFNRAAQPHSPAQTELNISLDEVRRLQRVDPRSEVVGDDFLRLANASSLAWKKAIDLGPYDVINLDLCDGVVLKPPSSISDNYYNALSRLLTLQARRKSAWLLLLTTRVGPSHVNETVRDALLAKYVDNLANCAAFREASGEKFAVVDEVGVKAAAEVPVQLLPLFLCGFCKWLLGLALSQQPPTTAKVLSVVGYQVDGNAAHEDLVSIAIRFTPTFVPSADPVGLAAPAVDTPDECVLATQMLRGVARRKNVDQLLSNNTRLNDEMVEATAKLLEASRYDADAYRKWVLSK